MEDGIGAFDGLSVEVVEEILGLLPLHGSVAAAAVCKRWRALLCAGTFCRQLAARHLSHRPWFFLVGVNQFLAAKTQAFGYDPESGRWHRFPAFQLPPHDQGSLTATHGLLFAFTGSAGCKLVYTPCLINKSSWRDTPPLLFPRRSPIIARVENQKKYSAHGSSDGGYHLVVAGGKALYNQLVVEMYDSQTDAWQLCAPLPSQFCLSSSQWMRSTVYDGKFIAYETDTGCMASLDLESRCWSNATLLKPANTIYSSFLIACGSSLVLAGLCRKPTCFKLWSVDFATLECTELGRMPDELYTLFDEEEDDEKHPLISCVGGGDFVYIYSNSWHKEYLACLCDLSHGKVTWRKMPYLPAPVNRFDKVVCFSSSSITPHTYEET